MATLSLIRGADLVAAPWKNGGGVTREVAAFPSHARLNYFVWRVSIADVAQAGPFSCSRRPEDAAGHRLRSAGCARKGDRQAAPRA